MVYDMFLQSLQLDASVFDPFANAGESVSPAPTDVQDEGECYELADEAEQQAYAHSKEQAQFIASVLNY